MMMMMIMPALQLVVMEAVQLPAQLSNTKFLMILVLWRSQVPIRINMVQGLKMKEFSDQVKKKTPGKQLAGESAVCLYISANQLSLELIRLPAMAEEAFCSLVV